MIENITYVLPSKVVTNEVLENELGKWTAQEIFTKTGIKSRHVLSSTETVTGLAGQAVSKLLADSEITEFDFLIVCTESAEYSLPSTACLIHKNLNLPKSVGAFDINLGCSGFVYCLNLCNGLIVSGMAEKIVLVTVDAYSKMMSKNDFQTRTIFGDAATATLVSKSSHCRIDNFVFGTDGSGAEQLTCKVGGLNEWGASFDDMKLYMNGPEIFNFTMKTVPRMMNDIIRLSGLSLDDFDKVIFHQANGFMLEHLRKKIGISEEVFVKDFVDYGNTVSSTIPICISNILAHHQPNAGEKWILAGFGVGLSWAGCTLEF